MTAVPDRLPRAAAAPRLGVAVVTPLALYAVGVAAGLLASTFVTYPTNEGSAYYVAVAQNLADGRGFVVDALWSYATPPLVLPRPAFELWQPLASLIAAAPMTMMSHNFAAAQLGFVLLGAFAAPLTWAITRDLALAAGVPADRQQTMAVGAGVVAAIASPVLLATAVPDSTLPFMVFGTAACWLAPKAWRSTGRPYLALGFGVCLGLAYLSRHEAMYIGLVVLAAGFAARPVMRWLMPAVIGGLVVVGPWLLRNLAVFGTPLPGQALDNAFLTSNEQIFDYGSRPTLGGFLDQGPVAIGANIANGTMHNLVDVVLVMAMPVGVVGLISAAVLLARRPAARRTAAGLLLVSGGLTFVIASLVFPVASMWGTFQHASGPFLLGLTVAAAYGADAAVDYVRRRRNWSRSNAWLAPLALSVTAGGLALLQLTLLSAGARETQARFDALRSAVVLQSEFEDDRVISDHPILLNLQALALPAQPPDVVLRLASAFDAQLIAIGEGRGDYPAAFRSGPLAHCFEPRPVPEKPAGLALFAIKDECRQ